MKSHISRGMRVTRGPVVVVVVVVVAMSIIKVALQYMLQVSVLGERREEKAHSERVAAGHSSIYYICDSNSRASESIEIWIFINCILPCYFLPELLGYCSFKPSL